MSHRKGELTKRQVKQRWPHQVALPFKAGRGISESGKIITYAEMMSVGPQSYHLTRDGHHFVVFGFAKLEDAESFAKRFGGEQLAAP
jgi:hypothetical protein